MRLVMIPAKAQEEIKRAAKCLRVAAYCRVRRNDVMENQKKPTVVLSEEQLDALVQSLLPVMQEFFNSERGRRIWAEHLEKIQQDNGKAA